VATIFTLRSRLIPSIPPVCANIVSAALSPKTAASATGAFALSGLNDLSLPNDEKHR